MKKRLGTKTDNRKVPLTARALLQRINRKLLPDSERIVKTRSRWVSTVGDYFRIDLNKNAVVDHDVNLENLGRELGVLRPYEALHGKLSASCIRSQA